MEAGADLDSELTRVLADRARTPNRTGRTVEAGKEPVAGLLDLAAPEPLELRAHQRVVALAQLPPTTVAQRRGALVESTMSVRGTVTSARSCRPAARVPVRNSCISSAIVSISLPTGA